MRTATLMVLLGLGTVVVGAVAWYGVHGMVWALVKIAELV